MKKYTSLFAIGFIVALLLSNNAGFAYSDVNIDVDYHKAIEYVTEQQIAKGYDDGTFHPGDKVNRAEFVKMVVLATVGQNFEFKSEDCFPDVKADDWFSPYVCYSQSHDIVSGYPDGQFRPANQITIVEVAKILTNVLGDGKSLKEGANWYSGAISYMSDNNYIPATVVKPNHEVTRAETAEMIWRMKKKISGLKSVDADLFEQEPAPSPQPIAQSGNIDIEKVRATWLDWYNTERESLGLDPYVYNSALDRTAAAWSDFSKERGYIDHKRPGQTAYYDYNLIKSWFADQGVTFDESGGTAFTESIGWNVYNCRQSDCTQYLIDDIKSSFNFFMSEKGKASRPHYDSIVSSNFTEIGLGIAMDEGKYYLTVHYAVEVE